MASREEAAASVEELTARVNAAAGNKDEMAGPLENALAQAAAAAGRGRVAVRDSAQGAFDGIFGAEGERVSLLDRAQSFLTLGTFALIAITVLAFIFAAVYFTAPIMSALRS